MFNRVKRMWKLSQKNPEELNKLLDVPDEVLKSVPSAGDGKAVFIPEGTEAEHEKFEQEEKGMKNIFGIGL